MATGRKISAAGRRTNYVGQEFIVNLGGQGTTGGVCLFTAPRGRRFAVVSVFGRWNTATSVSGGTVSLESVPSGTAKGSGTNICSTELAVDGTAATVNYAVVNDTEGSSGKNILEPGDSLFTIYTGNSGTLTSLAGLSVSVVIREIEPLKGA